MKKKTCPLCGRNKARRKCKLRQDELICPQCCAELRNADCGDCRYHKASKQYQKSKARKTARNNFIVEINKEVEKAVDDALLLAEKGDISKGEILLMALQTQYPDNHDVNFGIGLMKSYKEEFDEAIKYYTKAIETFPLFIEAHFNKALACKLTYDIKNMVESFKEVITIGDPSDDLVRKAKSILTDFEQSIMNTDNISLEQWLHAQDIFDAAFSYMQKNEWQKAIRGFEECLKISKRHVQSYGNIGMCHAQLGRKREAIEALDKALEIDPKYEPAIYNKVLIESLADDEKPELDKTISINYYEDFALKNKSYIKSIFSEHPEEHQ